MNLDTEVNKQTGMDNKNRIFQHEILEGLMRNPKKLSSKYFYDKNGDRLFQDIMAMPEYYLTKCELDIFKNQTEALKDLMVTQSEPFDLIELGAGDGLKSSFLLQHLISTGTDFTYMPIDISGNILSVLDKKLSMQIPELKTVCLEGEYFEMLEKASQLSSRKKVILFLGGNIGNMEADEAEDFCTELNKKLNSGDRVLIGFDLKKNPRVILDAYNDSTGITAAFNLNLLNRINNELDADFDTEQFEHYQTYDPVSGACRSYLVSLCTQNIHIGGQTVCFRENELIDMEISQKFSEETIAALAAHSGFQMVGMIKDSKKWFVDAAWLKK